MASIEIVTYGCGELMQSMLNGVAMVMGDSLYGSLITLIGMIGLAVVIMSLSVQKMDIKGSLFWLLSVMLIMELIVAPKTTAHIRDQVAIANGVDAQMYEVANVPVALAVLAETTSSIGYALTSLFELGFSSPDAGLEFSSTGLMFAARMVTESISAPITDAVLSSNLRHYVNQCVVPEIMNGNININDMKNSVNLWEYFYINGSPARMFLYEDKGTKSLQGCANGPVKQAMSTEFQAETKNGFKRFAKLLDTTKSAGDMQKINEKMMGYLPGAFKYFTGIKDVSATNIMQQALMRNILHESMTTMGGELNSPAIIENFMHIKTDVQNAVAASQSKWQASIMLPHAQAILSVILYAMFPIIVLFMLIPGMMSIAKKYLCILVWLQLWAPISALIQYATYSILRNSISGDISQADSLLNLATIASVHSSTAGAIQFSQYLTFAVPMISGFLVFGGTYMLSQAVSGTLGSAQGAGAQVATETATGNLSLDNSQIDTSTFNTEHGNKYDSNFSSLSGQSSVQTASGSIINHAADGHSSINSASSVSQMGQKVHIGNAIRSGLEKRLQSALSMGQQEMQNYSEHMGAVYRDVVDLGSRLGTGSNADITTTAGDTYSVNKAVTDTHGKVHKFAEDHNINDQKAASFLMNAGMELKLGKSIGSVGGFSVSGGGAYNLRSEATSSIIHQDALEYMRQTNLSDTVEHAARGIHENHFRSSDDQSLSLADNIGANFEAADQSSHSLQTHLDSAKTWQKSIQYTAEHSAQFEQDHTQHFATWLSSQPDSSGAPITIQGVDTLSQKDPELMQSYLSQYINETVDGQGVAQIDSAITNSRDAIEADFKVAQASLKGNQDIIAKHTDNMSAVLSDSRSDSVIHSEARDIAGAQYESLQGQTKNKLDENAPLRGESEVEHAVKHQAKKQKSGRRLTKAAAKGLMNDHKPNDK